MLMLSRQAHANVRSPPRDRPPRRVGPPVLDPLDTLPSRQLPHGKLSVAAYPSITHFLQFLAQQPVLVPPTTSRRRASSRSCFLWYRIYGHGHTNNALAPSVTVLATLHSERRRATPKPNDRSKMVHRQHLPHTPPSCPVPLCCVSPTPREKDVRKPINHPPCIHQPMHVAVQACPSRPDDGLSHPPRRSHNVCHVCSCRLPSPAMSLSRSDGQ